MESEREKRIRDRAYEIWQREGQPPGRHDEHWRQAEAELAAELEEAEGAAAAGNKPAGEAPPEAPAEPSAPPTPARRSRASPGKRAAARTPAGGKRERKPE